MSYWMSIEVFNGAFAARLWADAHADLLIETAVTHGASDWELKPTAWGVVFEVGFDHEAQWDIFRNSEAVRNALNTVPDPQTGILIYRGRSLDGGSASPRKPKPKAGSGANALQLPKLPFDTRPFLEPLPAFFTDSGVDRRSLTSSH